MTTPAELIILGFTKVRDNSIVIHSLSREFGRRGFITSLRKGGGTAMFLPMNIVEADIIPNSKSELWRASGFNCSIPLSGIRGNMYKNSMTLFLSEVLMRSLKEGASGDEIFQWCKGMILLLDSIEKDFSNFHLRFLAEYASVLGFAPSPESLMPFAGERFPELKQIVESTFAASMLVPLSGEKRNEMAEILIRFISHHSDSSINVQSLKVLRELFR